MGTCVEFFNMIVAALLAGPHGTFLKQRTTDRPMNWWILERSATLSSSPPFGKRFVCWTERTPGTLWEKEGRDRLPGT
jgi:hypothetical protein